MVVVSLSFIFAAALPPVARALGWSEVRTVSRGSQRSSSAERAGLAAVHEKEHALGIDDDDGLADLNFDLGLSAVVRVKTQVFEVAPEVSLPGAAPAHPKAALGSLPPGTAVRVLGERGAFLHILYDDQGDAEMGWVAKSDVTVRMVPTPSGSGAHRR